MRLGDAEYKRVPAAGPLVGHYIRCPKCGFKAIVVLRDENEGDSQGVDPSTGEYVGELTLEDPIECPRPGCRLKARVDRDKVTECEPKTS